MAHYIFIAPFRTLINLRTDYAQENADKLKIACENSILELEKKICGKLTTPHTNIKGQTRYLSLEEDEMTNLSYSIFEYQCSELEKKILSELINKDNLYETITINNLKLSFHDNTIGLCICDIELIQKESAIPCLISDFDSATAFQKFLETLQKSVLTPLYTSTRSTLTQENFMNKRKKWLVFFDLNYTDATKRFQLHDPMLWLARIFVVNESDYDPAMIAEWTKTPTPQRTNIDTKNSIEFNIGNSVLIKNDQDDKKIIEFTISAISFGQLYYAMFDIIGKNIIKLNRKSANTLKSKDLNEYLDQVDEISLFSKIISSEWNDLLFGMQGTRKRILSEAARVWSMSTLISNTLEKVNTASDRVGRLIGRKSIHIQRISELILTFIGGLSVIDITFSMITFSESDQYHPDTIPGIMDIMSNLPLDAGISISMIILCCVIILQNLMRPRR